jgi:mono/diheme cytochrome c family protein
MKRVIRKRHSRSTAIPLAAFSFAMATGVASGLPADVLSGDEIVAPQDSKALFRERCAKCHDAGIPGIPTPNVLAGFSKKYVVDALTNGLMADQALGLTDCEIDALAEYVSGEAR